MANHVSRCVEEFPQPAQQPRRPDLALPDYMRFPAVGAQRSQVPDVAIAVAADLRRPVFGIGLRLPGAAGAVVAVPEATVYEDHLAPAGENEVRLPWQRLAMQSVPVAGSVQQAAHDPLGLRIL